MMRKDQIPNLLTFGRVLAVPLALALMVMHASALPLLIIFILAAITDFFDGWLARKWNSTSSLGTMLDPIADKLLVALMLFYLAVITRMALLPIAIILLRELYISGLREFLALRSVPLPVSKGGKWKTALQMIAIIILYGAIALRMPELWNPGIITLWAAVALSLLSAVQYTRAAWPHIK